MNIQTSKQIKKDAVKKDGMIRVVPLSERNTAKSFADTVTQKEKTYIINKVYDLKGETVTLPYGVILLFKGNGLLRNGTIIGLNGTIIACKRIFDKVQVKGTWKCVGNAAWWAQNSEIADGEVCFIQKKVDCSEDIQLALDSAFREIVFPPLPYYVTDTLVLRKEKRLSFQGSIMSLSVAECQPNIKGAAIIFTDKDITLLRIAVKEGMTFNQASVAIEGGNFDVSLCQHYTKNCIEVRADDGEKLWGLTINTSVKGANPTADNPYLLPAANGTGINVNPVENAEMAGNRAYVSCIRINGLVSNFGTGIKATNYMGSSGYENWVTDMRIDGLIRNCPLAIDTNVEDADISATIQAGGFFDTENNGKALIRYTGLFRAAVASAIYDIQQNHGKWANQYALEITKPEATVTAYGSFKSFYLSSIRIAKPCVNGTITEK